MKTALKHQQHSCSPTYVRAVSHVSLQAPCIFLHILHLQHTVLMLSVLQKTDLGIMTSAEMSTVKVKVKMKHSFLPTQVTILSNQ